MIILKDVARESGFAPTTVSIGLNDAPLAQYIPARTKNLIKEAAETLNYRPNPYARSLRNNRSRTIGVIVFDISDPYCANILRGIEDGLDRSPYLLVLADTQNDRNRFERDIEMLLARRIEGLIAVANSLSLEVDLLSVLRKRAIPTIIIGRNFRDSMSSRRVPEDCSVIGFDDISMADCYNSPLTTIRQPMSDLGSIGVKLLLKRIQASLSKTRLPPEHVKVEPELIVRDSTARW